MPARKCKTLRTEFARNRESIVVNDEEVEDVEEFVYLGAIVDNVTALCASWRNER